MDLPTATPQVPLRGPARGPGGAGQHAHGALHGEGEWCAAWAKRLENGPRGRDYALGLAESLARVVAPAEA